MPIFHFWKNLIIWLLSGYITLAPSITVAQSQLFQSHDVLSLTLEAPFSKVTRSRGEAREYFPATLKYTNTNGSEVTIDLRVRTRGVTRSKVETCRFPPLRLNFRRGELEGTIFNGENNLKLVTHCQSRSQYEQYVLMEYLNYRILNLFTDKSFKVRLMEITYIDTRNGKTVATKIAFVIEDIERMAERLGLQSLKTTKVERAQYDSDALNFIEIFQYMIGNTDWSAIIGPEGEDCCHNIVPFVSEMGSVIPAPYDFDATGLVDAPYSAPSPVFKLRSVRQRLYRGFCTPQEVVEKNLSVFRNREVEVKALYESQAGLNSRTLDRAIAYLDEFYQTINNPRLLQKEIITACRGESQTKN